MNKAILITLWTIVVIGLTILFTRETGNRIIEKRIEKTLIENSHYNEEITDLKDSIEFKNYQIEYLKGVNKVLR